MAHGFYALRGNGCFGFLGFGAAYGTAKSGVGIASMGVMRPELVMKSIVPVVMAGVLGIYGLIIAVIISTGSETPVGLGVSYLMGVCWSRDPWCPVWNSYYYMEVMQLASCTPCCCIMLAGRFCLMVQDGGVVLGLFLLSVCCQHLRSHNCVPRYRAVVWRGVLTTSIHASAVNQTPDNPYYLFDGYAHLAAGLACGLAGLAAGMAIGIVGDAGVR